MVSRDAALARNELVGISTAPPRTGPRRCRWPSPGCGRALADSEETRDRLESTESGYRLHVERDTERRLQALELGCAADLALQRYDAVITELTQLVSLHPERERFHET